MRVMVLVKADEKSEAGVLPSEELLTAMGRYNEELVKAGVLLAGDGLHPSSKGARIIFSGKERTVVDGPFAEAKELIAGFWVIQAKSLDEAIEWAKRCPNPMRGESQIEIRQIFEAADFGEAFTPELQEQEERLREHAAQNQSYMVQWWLFATVALIGTGYLIHREARNRANPRSAARERTGTPDGLREPSASGPRGRSESTSTGEPDQ